MCWNPVYEEIVLFKSLFFNILVAFAYNAKTLCNCHSFFSFPHSSHRFWTDWQNFLAKFRQLYLQKCVTKTGSPKMVTPANYCHYVENFFMSLHGILCALKINSNGGSKWANVESCPSTTTNIISSILHCLWSPNLTGWWVIMKSSYP